MHFQMALQQQQPEEAGEQLPLHLTIDQVIRYGKLPLPSVIMEPIKQSNL
jgi:hypothetical protein